MSSFTFGHLCKGRYINVYFIWFMGWNWIDGVLPCVWWTLKESANTQGTDSPGCYQLSKLLPVHHALVTTLRATDRLHETNTHGRSTCAECGALLVSAHLTAQMTDIEFHLSAIFNLVLSYRSVEPDRIPTRVLTKYLFTRSKFRVDRLFALRYVTGICNLSVADCLAHRHFDKVALPVA